MRKWIASLLTLAFLAMASIPVVYAADRPVLMDPALELPLSLLGKSLTAEESAGVLLLYSQCNLLLRPWDTGYTVANKQATANTATVLSEMVRGLNAEVSLFYFMCAQKASGKAEYQPENPPQEPKISPSSEDIRF